MLVTFGGEGGGCRPRVGARNGLHAQSLCGRGKWTAGTGIRTPHPSGRSSTSKPVDAEDRSKPTHQRGPWMPKRSHKTYNVARDEV
jgi:hypothetical protein